MRGKKTRGSPRRDTAEVDISRGPLERDIEHLERRPAVPGKALEYIYMPSRGFMTGRLIKEGQIIRVIDLEGKQCFDCIIWDANDFDNVLNCCWTVFLNMKWDKWRPGDGIYSKHCDRLATIGEDTTDGTHAVVGAFCSEPYWRKRLRIPGCPNCADNFVAAMRPYGFSAEEFDWGSCISFFMPVIFNPDGSMSRYEVKNKPGDYIDLMAEMDIIVAISNCPGERSPANAYNPTPLQAVIFDPDKDYRARVKALKK
jgi:uncharacterized protein YcgI (DUF1989 family)